MYTRKVLAAASIIALSALTACSVTPTAPDLRAPQAAAFDGTGLGSGNVVGGGTGLGSGNSVTPPAPTSGSDDTTGGSSTLDGGTGLGSGNRDGGTGLGSGN